MPSREIAVKFEPFGKTVHVAPGTRLVDAAHHAGLTIDTPCGGQGKCGKCRVFFVDGPSSASDTERAVLGEEAVAQGMRLACQTRITEPCVIGIPQESLLDSAYQILTASDTSVEIGPGEGLVRKCAVNLPPPSREDPTPDVERLDRALGPLSVDVDVVRELPGRLRGCDWRGTAVFRASRLIDFEPGDTTAALYGLAVDVGTTTLVAALVDLNTGRSIGEASEVNPQTRFGDDVLSRILHATQHEGGLEDLRQAVVETLNDLVGGLAKSTGTERSSVYEAAFAGNTTMLHLLAGIDPRALGQVPFTPAYGRAIEVSASDLGLAIHPRGTVYLFPVIGGFIGGDTVACMVATDITHTQHTTILVDIGTNGEIVLWHDGRLSAASTAAGPAFEGARISDGMRAATGAIEHVAFGEDLEMAVIGGGAPVGICGSALIDLVAGLLECGLLEPSGRFRDADAVPVSCPKPLGARLVEVAGEPAFRLASADQTKTGEPIHLTQQDVREFQLATAAIRAGVGILLGQSGLEPEKVGRLLIAGGFGNYVRRAAAQRVGLFPPGLPGDRIAFVGNASLAGARLALCSSRLRAQAQQLAGLTAHVDLSLDPDFQMAFAMAMGFPDAT